ncbi:MAG: lipoyl synthase [Actinomycetes bacterium]
MDPLRVRFLGRVGYDEALSLQRSVCRGDRDYLFLLEHPTVITLGRRADASNVLDAEGISAAVVEVDRGGDVTLHAPGQIVAYPVITIDGDPHAIAEHVDHLEEAVISVVTEVLDGRNVGGVGRLDGHPGVWVGLETGTPAKICAVGVRTERHGEQRRTLHGIALNVDVDLRLFDAIVPCGIPNRSVTSLAALGATWPMGLVEDALGQALAAELFPGRPVQTASVRAVDDQDLASLGRESMARRRLRTAGVDPDQGLELATRKPEWLRTPTRMGADFRATQGVVADLGLVTVCEEAGCPNIFECWADGTATFMVNGERCTRACGFCLIDTSKPLALDPSEPERVAEAVARMGLAHAVVTCVARDDLSDGGARAIAQTIRAIRAVRPNTAVEILISDLKGDADDLQIIIDAAPDVLNHNLETVARLQRAVRPSAGYARSLAVLARASAAGVVAKSGVMLGLGETDDEVVAALGDLAAVGVELVTIGQYLRPSKDHLPVARFAAPEIFDALAAEGRALGLSHVQASPLTRSSYHAREAASTVAPVPVSLGSRASQSS